MNNQLEDRVRNLLVDRTAGVVPPTGWEDRVLSAGRRRRIRRRAGSVAGAVAAVVIVMLAAGTIALPQAINDQQPVDGPGGTVDVGDLPEGGRTTHPQAVGEPVEPATLLFDEHKVTIDGYVLGGGLAGAADGVVAIGTWDADRLLYVGADGSEKVLGSAGMVWGFAVSADGTRVAWWESRPGKGIETLRLAELPSGRIIESRPIDKDELPSGLASVAAYVNDQVVIEFESERSPYAWDLETGELAPWPDEAPAGQRGGFVDVSETSDTVLLRDGTCVRNLSLSDPQAPARWQRCGLLGELRISPDGSKLAGTERETNEAWVRDLDTGELIWKQRFTQGVDVWDSIREREVVSGFRTQQLEWESSNHLLLAYGTSSDLDMETFDVLRCSDDRPDCERVPAATDHPVTALGSD